MDEHAFTEAVQYHKQVLQAAEARKGQKPNNKASRQQLSEENVELKEHSTKTQSTHEASVHQYFTSDAYPPSSTPVAELEPITISDLRLETHHLGKVLFVRTFGYPVRISGVQNVVEDEHGDVDRLALYNGDSLTEPEHLLPKDAVFAIKQPFYRTITDGYVSIRIDHRSDLVRLQPLDPRVPDALRARLVELEKSAEDWKKEGNTLYAKKEYVTAVHAYSQGLTTCGDIDRMLKCDLLRNRSIVNFCLERYEWALTDAKGSLIVSAADVPVGEKTAKLNAKAYYRAGRAAYELDQFEQAEDLFNQARVLTSDDADVARELKRTAERLAEMTSGSYDFRKMSQSASKTHNRLDHASFTKKVDVRGAGNRGRGLFATKSIKAGELVLCEKAFCAAFDSDEGGETYVIVDPNTERYVIGRQATILFDTVQKMLYNPCQASHFLDLHDGGYNPKCTASIVDGRAVIDTFQTQAIIQHNAFECPIVRSAVGEAPKQAGKSTKRMTAGGVWVTASYINHACDGNAVQSFIGDMMSVRASKDIAAGAEITMPYRLPDPSVSITQQETQKVWGFKCDCAICTTETKSSAEQLKTRATLAKEAHELMLKHNPSQYQPNATFVAKAEKLYVQLQATYDKQLFKDRPRIALARLGKWLCQSRVHRGGRAEIISTALDVLRDLGYVVTIAGQSVRFDRTHCSIEDAAVEVSMYVSHSYHRQGEDHRALQFRRFAEELYQTLYGEMGGFREKYEK